MTEKTANIQDAPAPPPNRMSRQDWILLAAIVAGALALRIIYILQYRSSPTFDEPVMDPLYHVEWARAFAQGFSFMEGEPYFRAPLYPWWLGICFKLFGENLLAPRILQAVMGALSCGLLFMIGHRLFGRITAAAAAIVAATYWLFIYFNAELLIVPLILLLDLLLLWLLILADERRGWKLFALAGLVMGVSAIARPNILLFGLAACLWIVVRDRRMPVRGVLHAFLFGAACLAPIVPVTVRNAVEGDDLVLISSQGGVNFYIGNNEVSDGALAVVPGTRSDWWGGYRDSIAIAEKDEGRELKPSEVSRYYFRKGLAYIAEDPLGWLELTWRKFVYYWNAVEIQNNQPIRFFAERYGPVVKWLPVGFGIISPLAILGLLIFLRKPGRLFPLWGFAAVYGASVILFFVCTRFRNPVTPVLILAACEAVRRACLAAAERRWPQVAAAVVIAVPLFWWVNKSPEGLIDPDFQGHLTVGEIILRQGDVDGAIDELREGLRLNPEFGGLRLMLGHALFQKADIEAASLEGQGRTADAAAARNLWYAEAEKQLLRVLDSDEGYSRNYRGRAAFMLYKIAAQRQDMDAAVGYLRDTIRADAHDAEAHYCLGYLLAGKGEQAEAEAMLRKAVDLDPGMSRARFDLARLLALQSDSAGAMAQLREALRLEPGAPEYWDFLISYCMKGGMAGAAVPILEEALSRLPSGSPAAGQLKARIDRLRNMPGN